MLQIEALAQAEAASDTHLSSLLFWKPLDITLIMSMHDDSESSPRIVNEVAVRWVIHIRFKRGRMKDSETIDEQQVFMLDGEHK